MGLPALTTAIAALARASLPDAKILRDKAAAVEVYLKRAKEAGRIQYQATEIRLRAERRIGELLRVTVKRGNPKGRTVRPLADLGISKTQSSRWQLIARLPEKVFEEHIGKRRELTTAAVIKLARAHVRASRRHSGPDAGGNIFTCDLAELPVKNDSVDLILTDPPYADIQAYRRLSEFAASKLKPGGFCLAYSGRMKLPDVLTALASQLDYYWLIACGYGGPKNAVLGRQIQVGWKTIVWFCKPPARRHEWTTDFLQGGTRDKELHIWQQPQSESAYLIERLSEPGQLVVDPFCGSGTVLAAAKTLGRKWIGCDVDAGAARIARKRVA